MDSVSTIIIGGGLSGLVAAYEITKAGKKVILLEQESERNLGGQAFWSFGGLFFVDSKLQRRMGITDSYELAAQDWMGTAQFDREEDYWPRKWAEAYLRFATEEKYDYVRSLGMTFFPIVSWAERGAGTATGHGNSVPRFHIPWGTGEGIVKPFVEKAYEALENGLLEVKFRHRATGFTYVGGKINGVEGNILREDKSPRGEKSNREVIDSFTLKANNVVIASGGIGANLDLVKRNWPDRMGKAPEKMVSGVPDYVDGKMLEIAENSGVKLINKDRMWHYVEGIKNWDPIWSNHGIRVLPGPSSVWLDATGKRFPPPYLPGFDTLGTLEYILKTGYEYSWFILTQKIIKKEFALSGSEQNPDLTNKDYIQLLGRLFGKDATKPVEAFKEHGEDFIVESDLKKLVARMNKLAGNEMLEYEKVKYVLKARDRELDNKYSKDTQINYMRSTRKYLGDKLSRVAPLHKILDPKNGPLIAVHLNILTRKTLGGIQTNLNGQAFTSEDKLIPNLYAVGEAAGFGGGGMHGYRSLEGTFLGGCIFTGMTVGKYIGGKDE